MNLAINNEKPNEFKHYKTFSKILKFDENNQYGRVMSQNIPYGGLCVN